VRVIAKRTLREFWELGDGTQIAWLPFVATHAKYDMVDAETI